MSKVAPNDDTPDIGLVPRHTEGINKRRPLSETTGGDQSAETPEPITTTLVDHHHCRGRRGRRAIVDIFLLIFALLPALLSLSNNETKKAGIIRGTETFDNNSNEPSKSPYDTAPRCVTCEGEDHRFLLEGDSFVSLAMHPKKSLMAVASGRGSFPILIFDTSTRDPAAFWSHGRNWTLERPSPLTAENETSHSKRYTESVEFCPTGPYVATVDRRNRLNWWTLDLDEKRDSAVDWQEFEDHTDIVRDLAFHPHLPFLATASDDKTVKIWHFETGIPRVVATLDCTHAKVRTILFRPDGKELAIGSGDGTLSIVDTSKLGSSSSSSSSLWLPQCGDVLHETVGPSLFALAYSADHSMLATAGAAGENGKASIYLHDTSSRNLLQVLKDGHTDRINSLAFGNNHSTLFSASSDGTVNQWNITNLPHYKFQRLVKPSNHNNDNNKNTNGDLEAEDEEEEVEEAFGVAVSPSNGRVFIISRDAKGGALREAAIRKEEGTDDEVEAEEADEEEDDDDYDDDDVNELDDEDGE